MQTPQCSEQGCATGVGAIHALSPRRHHATRRPAPSCLAVREAQGGPAPHTEHLPLCSVGEGKNTDIRAWWNHGWSGLLLWWGPKGRKTGKLGTRTGKRHRQWAARWRSSCPR